MVKKLKGNRFVLELGGGHSGDAGVWCIVYASGKCTSGALGADNGGTCDGILRRLECWLMHGNAHHDQPQDP